MEKQDINIKCVDMVLKTVNVGGSNEKGIYTVWSEAVHTCLTDQEISGTWSGKRQSNALKGQVDFIKNTLCHDDWPSCDHDCSVYCGIDKKDTMQDEKLTESWVPDVVITTGIDNHEIPVVIMEIHGHKANEDKDQTK